MGSPVAILTKRPAESRLYSWDFSALLDTGETLAAVQSVTATAQGLVTGAAALSLDGAPSVTSPFVYQRLSGGSDGEDYVCAVVATTSTGNTLEADGILQVRAYKRSAA